MPNEKSGSSLSSSTFFLAEKLSAPDVHPRFISRIQRVLFEKEKGARTKLIKTYCLLRKLTNQLHTYEEAFDRAQYKLLVSKCEALCRNSRAAATSDRPHLSQVLSLREEVIDLRSIIAVATQGTYRNGSSQLARPSTSPDDAGKAAEVTSSAHSDPLADNERLLEKKLSNKSEPAPKLAPETAIDHRSLASRLSS